jgi:putative DNA primase/helicase
MGKDFFDFTPLFKLMISGNYRPGLRSVDEAIRRRLRLIPFNVTFPLDKRDPDLVEKLKAELPGIALWMITGCAMWQRDGLNPPNAVAEATAAYLHAEDIISTWISECCMLDREAWTQTSQLYSNYGAWMAAAGEFKVNQREFSQRLEQRGDLKLQRKEGGNGYLGIKLTPAALLGEVTSTAIAREIAKTILAEAANDASAHAAARSQRIPGARPQGRQAAKPN